MEKILLWLRSSHVMIAMFIIIKLYIVRILLLGDVNPLRMAYLELPFLIALFLLISLLFRTWSAYFMLFLNALFSLLFVSMLLYERYFNVIPSYYDMNQMSQAGSVSDTASMLFSPFDLLFFIDFILIGAFVLFQKGTKKLKSNVLQRKMVSILLIFCLALSSLLVYLKIDEPLLDSGLYAKEHGLINSQLLQAFSRAETVSAMGSYDPSMSYEDILALKGNELVPFEEQKYFGAAKDKHLIAIQVESLQDFVIDMELNGQVITPFLNQLVDESLYFDEVYQQIGAGNTSDTEVLFNMSVYPSGLEPTVNEVHKGMAIPSLPRLLGEHGYHSSTYHTDDVTYWNRDHLYPALGFDTFYDKEVLGEEDVIGIGSSDEYLFDQSLNIFDELLKDNEKIYANVVTMTSHTPFVIPEKYQELDLPPEYEDTLIGNYLQSIHYTDKQIEKFAQGLKDRGLWDDSLITIFGDHSGVHGQLLLDEDVSLLREYFGRGYSLVDRFNVPFIVTVPGEIEGERISHTGGHIDMMPTVLNLLGITPDNMTIFGHNLLEYNHNLLGMRYYLPLGSFINNQVMFSEQSAKRDQRMFNLETSAAYKTDEIKNLLENAYREDRENVMKIMDASDQYLLHLFSES
ncbi:LTA synthase family protein [Jeotgalibacillus sp. S-D1]|uniref:LTA synthase family protein n=1 Tax=Jeotgalibacillus sp. S-D1 TaxID=2552189 RepID=UPI00105A661D|nr:LTA synthase family protein [Jeotgalibacillus sp. S-D1]TDL32611.1 LTA synthase family protein [Jeotgalibacillus sp. S-D1]